VGTLLIATLMGDGAEWQRWVHTGALLAGAVALGICAAGIELVPAFELARLGERGAHQLSARAMMPWPSPGLRVLVSQGIAGDPSSFGVVALGLVPAALLGRRHRALGWWAVLVVGVATVFALHRWIPFYRLLPGLGASASRTGR